MTPKTKIKEAAAAIKSEMQTKKAMPAKTPKTPKTPIDFNSSDSSGGIGSFDGRDTLETDFQPFPVDMLPPILRNMTKEVAAVALVPESLAAINLLGIVSASIGGGLLIDSGGGRVTPGNLYLLGIAKSGTGKGRTFAIVTNPFQKLEAEEIETWEREVRPGLKKDLRLIEQDLKRLEKSYGAADESRPISDIEQGLQEKEKRKSELEKALAVEPGFSVADVTKEKLAMSLEPQPGQALASLSPEGRGVIDVIMGKYSKGGDSDEDLYLSAFSREPHKVSRVGRPPVSLKTPCLSILWLIQPDKARKLTESEAITESGLLPRFLICDSKAEVMDEPEEPATMNKVTVGAWHELVECLLSFREKGDDPITIKHDAKARQVIRSFVNENNARLRSGGDLQDLTAFVSRWGENAWRLALVLHCAEHGEKAGTHDLSEETAMKAVEIVKWFSREQLAILGPHRNRRARNRLNQLLLILGDHGRKRTLRDLSKSHNFPHDEVKSLAMDFPTKIRVEKIQPEGGGRPSEVLTYVIDR